MWLLANQQHKAVQVHIQVGVDAVLQVQPGYQVTLSPQMLQNITNNTENYK